MGSEVVLNETHHLGLQEAIKLRKEVRAPSTVLS
jgi:hypothetical protein